MKPTIPLILGVLFFLSQRTAQAQVQVGLLSTEVPNSQEFTLHGTLPVPKGTYLPEALAGASLQQRFPVVLVDSDGNLVVPQIETVSRYPNPADGAAVIELIARVHRPANSQRGELISYRVLDSKGLPLAQLAPDYDPNHPVWTWLQLDPTLVAQVVAPSAFLIRVQDAKNNWYASKLVPGIDLKVGSTGTAKITKAGHELLEISLYTTLTPLGQAAQSDVLPHHVGVHAYISVEAGSKFMTLDLRVNNGPSNQDPNNPADDALGKLYFKNLEILTPSGWTLQRPQKDTVKAASYPTGTLWMAHPIFDPAPGAGLHVLPAMGQFHRRFVLALPEAKTQGLEQGQRFGLAFCQPGVNSLGDRLWSWWNPYTANYQTQNCTLPGVPSLGKAAVRSKLSGDFAYVADKLEYGTPGNPPLVSGQVGWMHPYGQAYGGITGGIDVNLFEGVPTAWSASRDGFRQAELIHRMQSDRQPDVAYDADGTPATLEELLVNGPEGLYFPGKLFLTTLQGSDPFGQKSAPTAQADWVANQGLKPPYEDELLSFEPIDMQHLIRYIRTAKVLAWLANDSLAKDDIQMQAALVRMSYNIYPNEAGGFTTPTNMLSDMQFVKAHPQRGFDFDRGEGWMLDTMACNYALGSVDTRKSDLNWFKNITGLVFDGQANCHGYLQAKVSSKVLDGNFRARQNYEEAIVQNGLWSALQTVFADTGTLEESKLEYVLSTNVAGMISDLSWDPVKQAPYQQIAVGPLDPDLHLFCTALPPGGFEPGDWDNFQCWNSFLYAFRLSFDPTFLVYAGLMAGSLELKTVLEQSGLDNIENRAGLIGFLQFNGN